MNIVKLLQNDDTKKTVSVISGYKYEVTDITDDVITGFVLFKDYRFPITWKSNGFPTATKTEPEYYHLRLIQKVKS
jgi:hypothetical protein